MAFRSVLLLLAVPLTSVIAFAQYVTEVREYWVAAPNGSRLYTRVIQPRTDIYPGQKFPAVIFVPGGLGAGAPANKSLAQRGFVEVNWNAEGRGANVPGNWRSDGIENYNGFIHQDDLKAMLEFVHTLPNVVDNNVGVSTSSYGITMGAGCLGRYPGLEVKFLMDGEGPHDHFVVSMEPWSLDSDTTNDRWRSAYQVFRHYSLWRDSSDTNRTWWAGRQAVSFIASIKCYYMRVQAEYDHVQPPNAQWPGFYYPPVWYQNKHAVDMVNGAVRGSAPWVRMNGTTIGNPINATYDSLSPPTYYSGTMASHPGEEINLLLELAALPALSPLVPTNLAAQVSVQSIRLSWRNNPPSDSVIFYEVYRSRANQRDSLRLIRATTDSIAVDSTAASGVTWYYGVKAVNRRGYRSDFSELVSAIIAGIEREEELIPRQAHLYQNYPNPFNPTTKMSFVISHWSLVSLRVYDVLGREVATVVNEELPAGEHSVVFNGSSLAGGVYLYRLQSRDPSPEYSGSGRSFSQTNKMVLIK